jgi:hypothetical protein
MKCPTCGVDPEHHGALLRVAIAAGDLVQEGRKEDNLDGVVYATDNLITKLNELHESFAEGADEVH